MQDGLQKREPSSAQQYKEALDRTVAEDEFTAESLRSVPSVQANDTQAPKIDELGLSAKSPVPIASDVAAKARYELGMLLGAGASGEVYAAHDLNFGREIAIKFLRKERLGDASRILDFIREARVTAKLEHPNILPIYDVNFSHGQIYFTMRKAEGQTLHRLIQLAVQTGQPSPLIDGIAKRVEILIKLCDAVAYAHSRGIVHQDIKPGNILLGQYGEVVLVDWGTATSSDERILPGRKLVGTPAYMSPEQARREHADERSDVYCLGATFFHLLTLRQPTFAADPEAFWEKKRQGAIDPVTAEELKKTPPVLLEAALKAMAPNPKDRYASVTELRDAIRAYQAHSESIALTMRAQQTLENAQKADDYVLFNEASFGFGQAIKIWAENPSARRGLSESRMKHGECALKKGDLELAASVLDAADPGHGPLLKKIAEARAARTAQRRRVRLMQGAAATLGLICAVLAGYFVYDYFRYFGQWKVVYQEDFTAPKANLHSLLFAGASWESDAPPPPIGPEGLKVPAGMLFWLRDVRLRGNVRIEVQVRWPYTVDGLDLYLNASRKQESNSWTDPAGYLAQFGGYDNTINFMAALPRCQNPYRTDAVSFEFKEKHVYHLAFQREDDELSMWVDGVLIHRSVQGLPLPQSGFDSLGMRGWTNFELLSMTVLRKAIPEKASPLVAGDALLAEGNNAAALRIYRELAGDFPGSKIGEQALMRAYLVTYTSIELKDREKIRGELRAEIAAQYPNFQYHAKLLEADCIGAWKEKQYAGALSILPEIFKRDPDSRIALQLADEQHDELPPEVSKSLMAYVGQTRRVAYLDLDGLGIRDLTPLAGMKLVRLDCNENGITSLEPLRGMSLKYLSCEDNQIVDLEPLRGMPLNVFYCGRNQISSLEPLRGMQLRKLKFEKNAVSDLDPLRGMKIASLTFDANKVQKLDGLSGMPLDTLNCCKNEITSLEPLAGSPIRILMVEENKIESLAPLHGLKLQILHVGLNPVSDLEPLKDVPLVELFCEKCKVSDLGPLRGAPLSTLNATGCPISSLEPIRHDPINSLEMSDTLISDLEFTREMPLQRLSVRNCKKISNIEPLRGKQLLNLGLANTAVADLSPLTETPEVTLDTMGSPIESIGPLRDEPSTRNLVDWSKWSDSEFEALLAKWSAAGANPKIVKQVRVGRLIQTNSLNKLKSLASEFEGHHYLVLSNLMKWDETQQLCAKIKAHLLTLSSEREQSFVLDLLPYNEDIWLGLECGPDGEHWVTGEPVVYRGTLSYGDRFRQGRRFMTNFNHGGIWCPGGHNEVLPVIEWDE